MYPTPRFTRKAVYHVWQRVSSTKWKRDEDEVKSAHILLEEAAQTSESLYQVHEIPLPEVEGYTVLAFALPNVLRQWGGRIRELALDSACKSFLDPHF